MNDDLKEDVVKSLIEAKHNLKYLVNNKDIKSANYLIYLNNLIHSIDCLVDENWLEL